MPSFSPKDVPTGPKPTIAVTSSLADRKNAFAASASGDVPKAAADKVLFALTLTLALCLLLLSPLPLTSNL